MDREEPIWRRDLHLAAVGKVRLRDARPGCGQQKTRGRFSRAGRTVRAMACISNSGSHILTFSHSLLLVENSLLGPKKFPVLIAREFGSKPLIMVPYLATNFGQEGRIFQNSLLFSLLSGNWGWRPVRSGLHPQAGSRVSSSFVRFAKIRANDAFADRFAREFLPSRPSRCGVIGAP